MGADLSTHLSQPVTPDLLRRADLVYTMTDAHLEEVMELYPWAARKTFRLDPEGDVADPIGSSDAVYRRVAGRLGTVIQERLKELSL
jgi:protein-tyrosine-phosphatase